MFWCLYFLKGGESVASHCFLCYTSCYQQNATTQPAAPINLKYAVSETNLHCSFRRTYLHHLCWFFFFASPSRPPVSVALAYLIAIVAIRIRKQRLLLRAISSILNQTTRWEAAVTPMLICIRIQHKTTKKIPSVNTQGSVYSHVLCVVVSELSEKQSDTSIY